MCKYFFFPFFPTVLLNYSTDWCPLIKLHLITPDWKSYVLDLFLHRQQHIHPLNTLYLNIVSGSGWFWSQTLWHQTCQPHCDNRTSGSCVESLVYVFVSSFIRFLLLLVPDPVSNNILFCQMCIRMDIKPQGVIFTFLFMFGLNKWDTMCSSVRFTGLSLC